MVAVVDEGAADRRDDTEIGHGAAAAALMQPEPGEERGGGDVYVPFVADAGTACPPLNPVSAPWPAAVGPCALGGCFFGLAGIRRGVVLDTDRCLVDMHDQNESQQAPHDDIEVLEEAGGQGKKQLGV